MNKDDCLAMLLGVVAELNESLDESGQIPLDPQAKLYGDGSGLDSMGLVTLLIAVEQKIEDTLDVTLTLADERAMSRSSSPFRTVATLADYVNARIEEQ